SCELQKLVVHVLICRDLLGGGILQHSVVACGLTCDARLQQNESAEHFGLGYPNGWLQGSGESRHFKVQAINLRRTPVSDVLQRGNKMIRPRADLKNLLDYGCLIQ